ncbi:single-stranded DNA-binding protein [Arenimonas caeni]|uniref:Single-stranded DNA-binding protein n=1 Tax=Arenimonas caeni TaxID=2058085 RepID=A0A2P6MAY6_9GAMM|nr:single-stranded DNA-binding protein [Arenimonas caeni]PRH83163.1 hypothetical protein C6N40_03085 [Arenimonas caeni]
MKIKIENTEVQTFPAREGKKERRIQRAMVAYGNGEVRKWDIGLNRDQPAWPVGEYQLDPASFYPGKYGPEVSGWPQLVRLDGPKPSAPRA